MADVIGRWLFDPSGLTPHGFCLLWEPWLIWTQALANSAIGLAYFSIPLALAYFARRRRDLVFRPMFWLFAAFILLCGAGHWLDLVTLWVPAYPIKAGIDAATAVVSVATAIALWPLMPKALALPSPAQMQAASGALRESEARFRALFMQAPLPLHSLDGDARLVSVSDRWLDFFGCKSRGEVLGRRFTDFMTGDAARSFDACWARVLGTGACDDAELSVVKRSGESADVFWSARLVHSDEGRPLSAMGVMVDVTARRLAEAALERNHAVQAVMESTGESVFTLSRDWRVTFLNGRALALMAEGRDLAGQVLWDAFPGLSGPGMLSACRRSMAERVPAEAEQFYEPRQHHYAVRTFPFDDGGISLFFRDLTAERRAEKDLHAAEAKASEILEELQESQAKLEAALASMTDALFISDAEGNLIHFNDAFATFHRFGGRGDCARALAEYPAFLDVFTENGEPAPLEQWAVPRALRGETAVGAVYRLRRKDTGESWVGSYNLAPIRDRQGTVVGSVVTARDITEQLRADEALRDSEASLRSLVETVNLGVLLTRGRDGTIRFWSEGCARLYGWTAEEAVGQTVGRLLRTSYPLPFAEIDAAAERDGEWNGDLRHVTRDGRELVVTAHLVLRRSADGDAPMLLEALTDVTAQRHAEAALAELNRHLEERVREAVREREAAQERAKRAQHMQALGQIAGGVAHEFNNILQAVQGGATLIKSRAADPASVRKFADIVLQSSGRGAVITDRLLAFAGRGSFHAETIESAAMLDAMRDILAHTLGGHIAVRVDLQPMLPAVTADRGGLETALVNLATNARDAMAEGGILSLAARQETVEAGVPHPAALRPGRYVRFVVSDNGTGMDQETLGRAAEPFFTTKPPGSGTGLGLSMAKGFAEQSGGGLAIGSAPGCGTTVTLWLPAANGGAAASRQRVREPVATAKPQTRVLLVDDEEMVRETLAAGLEDAGLAVLVAASGAEALALLDAGEPVDVLVTDFSMPGMDGMTLVRHAQARRKELTALILTGFVDIAGQNGGNCGQGGPFAVVRKPITAAQLAERLAEALASKG